MTVNPNSTLDFGTNKNFTIDAWIKGHASPIVSNVSSTQIGYSVFFGNNSELRLDMGVGSAQLMSWSGPPITPGVWTFVAVVVDRTTQKVTLYTAAPGNALATSGPLSIPNIANAGIGLPLKIGGCPGNPNGCDTIIDELEIYDRPLTQPELQSIFDAGSAGKCVRKGMTWLHTASNAQTGTITVGCSGCNAYQGDTVCTQQLPLLCIYKPAAPFSLPVGVIPIPFYSEWSGGVVGTTAPVAGNSFAYRADADSYCAAPAQFGPGWRAAEFHDGKGWNFQAYGGTVSAPTRFWVDINDQPNATCWAP